MCVCTCLCTRLWLDRQLTVTTGLYSTRIQWTLTVISLNQNVHIFRTHTQTHAHNKWIKCETETDIDTESSAKWINELKIIVNDRNEGSILTLWKWSKMKKRNSNSSHNNDDIKCDLCVVAVTATAAADLSHLLCIISNHCCPFNDVDLVCGCCFLFYSLSLFIHVSLVLSHSLFLSPFRDEIDAF